MSAHRPVTAPIVLTTFRQAADQHGYPASTLTDNGMVYTVRLAGHGRRRPQRLRSRAPPTRHRPEELPTQPPHHLRQGRTLPADHEEVATRPARPAHHDRRAADPARPFVDEYNHRRPHRSLPHRATPATAYTRPTQGHPDRDRSTDTHDRVRHDTCRPAGNVTLRVAGQLRHIGIGRTYARTHVILLVQDLDVRVVNAATGELLRELTIDPSRDYQPTEPTRNDEQPEPTLRRSGLSAMS